MINKKKSRKYYMDSAKSCLFALGLFLKFVLPIYLQYMYVLYVQYIYFTHCQPDSSKKESECLVMHIKNSDKNFLFLPERNSKSCVFKDV